jgi:phosphatidylglycerophosphate synthase
MITTYSLILGLVSAYYYYHNEIYLFVLCFALSYFFDCLDGYIARKYNMKSEFGSYYDSISDISVNVLLIYIVYIKYKTKINNWILIIFLTSVFLLNLELSCQNKINDQYNYICPDSIVSLKNKGFMKYLRWFSPATFNIIFIGLLVYIKNL